MKILYSSRRPRALTAEGAKRADGRNNGVERAENVQLDNQYAPNSGKSNRALGHLRLAPRAAGHFIASRVNVASWWTEGPSRWRLSAASRPRTIGVRRCRLAAPQTRSDEL